MGGSALMVRHNTLLIACSDPEHRKHLRSVLEEHYHLLEAATIPQIKLLLEYNITSICAVLVDTSLRTASDKLELMSPDALKLLDQVPVVVISPDETSSEDLSIFFRYGASDVIPLHYDPYAMLCRIESIVELYLYKQNLETMAQEKADMIRHSSDSMVDALSSIIEYRSVESGNHILRVRYFTRILMEEVMRQCPEYGLNDRLVSIISSASALHDIGKIAIPDAILMKPEPLNAAEWEIMKTHSITGCHILDNLKGTVEEEYLRYAHNICHYHHERWDGRGNPEGLMGDDIPICAQVVGLADAYDALTSTRVYKSSFTFVEAVNMILKGECGAFSPKLLECFKNVTEKFEALTREYADGRAPKDAPFDMTLPPPSLAAANSMENARAMYHALIHYIGAFLVEVELSQQFFHVIYNPYPEILALQGITTLQELQNLMLEQIVVPHEREKLSKVLFQEIPQFVEEDRRRTTYFFHFQGQNGTPGGAFEMTLLRSGSQDAPRKSLAVLCRKLPASTIDSSISSTNFILPTNSYICRNDKDFTLIRADDSSLSLGGYTIQEIMTELKGKLSAIIHPDDQEMVRRAFDQQLEEGTLVHLEHRVVFKQGAVVWVANKSRLIIGEDGQEYLYSSLSDISASKAALEQLKERMARYEVILAQTENILFEWDLLTDSIDFSDTWEQIFGSTPRRQSMNSLIHDGAFFHPDDIPAILSCIHNLKNGSHYEMAEARVAAHRGRYLWCRFRASAARDGQGNLLKVMGIIINIDAEKKAERALQDRADRDSLTKLLNKAAGRKHIESYLSQYPDGIRCALLVIDLDDFKHINDHYGHLFGDAVLTKTARAIEKHFQAQDIVSRIGGDEFMVLVRGVADRNLLSNRCRSLVSALRQAFQNGSKQIPLRCSIGIALAPEHGKNYYELFDHADQALYQAKANGKNTFCFYDSKENKTSPIHSIRAGSTPIDSDSEPGLAEDNFVRFTFQKLYTTDNVKGAVNEIIGILGKKMNVSRVYVFENTEDDRFCNNTFEWCNDRITPEIQNLQMISYETDIPGYPENFNEQGIFYCPDVSALPDRAREILEPQGVKSMLQCAIRQEGQFRGYIGFDECSEQRMWTQEEISMLTFFSDILSIFLQKYREQETLRIQAEELRTLLDNQNSWIYIVDPDTWKLKYLNKKAQSLSPNVQPEMVCYHSLLGRPTPCPGCPLEGIREKQTCQCFLKNDLYGGEVLAEATMIHWQGEENCIVTCRHLPPR